MTTTTIKYFAFAHLPAHLQAVSKPIGELAQQFEQQLPDGPEKSAGMRKLLEAKDCFVRAALDAPKPAAPEKLGGQAIANGLNPHYEGQFEGETAEQADARRAAARRPNPGHGAPKPLGHNPVG